MVWVLVAVETVTFNCPTFCELLPCSAGLVLGLDSVLSGQAWACVRGVGWGGKTEGRCLRQRPTGGPAGSFWLLSPSTYGGILCPPGDAWAQAAPCTDQLGNQEEAHCFSERVPPVPCGVLMALINQPFTTPSLALKDGVPAVAWGGGANSWYSCVSETVRWSEASKQNPSSSLSLDPVPSCLPSLYPLESNPCSEGEPGMKH